MIEVVSRKHRLKGMVEIEGEKEKSGETMRKAELVWHGIKRRDEKVRCDGWGEKGMTPAWIDLNQVLSKMCITVFVEVGARRDKEWGWL